MRTKLKQNTNLGAGVHGLPGSPGALWNQQQLMHDTQEHIRMPRRQGLTTQIIRHTFDVRQVDATVGQRLASVLNRNRLEHLALFLELLGQMHEVLGGELAGLVLVTAVHHDAGVAAHLQGRHPAVLLIGRLAAQSKHALCTDAKKWKQGEKSKFH